MPVTFEQMADKIDLLRKSIEMIEDEVEKSILEYRKLYPAYSYMKQLIAIFRTNPNLVDEWVNILDQAGIPEPAWKDEYYEPIYNERE
jgi:DNA-binding XRE family transcriptional regulator